MSPLTSQPVGMSLWRSYSQSIGGAMWPSLNMQIYKVYSRVRNSEPFKAREETFCMSLKPPVSERGAAVLFCFISGVILSRYDST